MRHSNLVWYGQDSEANQLVRSKASDTLVVIQTEPNIAILIHPVGMRNMGLGGIKDTTEMASSAAGTQKETEPC